jgi:hypothetical protein
VLHKRQHVRHGFLWVREELVFLAAVRQAICFHVLLVESQLDTVAGFDLGVYVTVVGAAMLLISVLGDSRHSSMSGPVPKE